MVPLLCAHVAQVWTGRLFEVSYMAQQLLAPLLRGPLLVLSKRPLLPELKYALNPFTAWASVCAHPAAHGGCCRSFAAPTAEPPKQVQEGQQQQQRPPPLGRVPAACGPTLPARADGDSSTSTSSSSNTDPGHAAGPSSARNDQLLWPWNLIASLPRSAPYQVPALSTAPLSTYLAYLGAARQGMLSVIDMGVVRQDGQTAREQLARKEAVLGQLVDIHPVCGQDDEELGDLSPQQLQRVAQAATAAGTEVTAEEVEGMVMDYFVAKRCWELMQAQRTLRVACQKQYEAGQQQPAGQPDAASSPHGRRRRGQRQQQRSTAGAGEEQWVQEVLQQLPHLEPHMSLEDQLGAVGAMPIWDAFHDADLGDMAVYIQAALDGDPSIYLPYGSQQQHLSAGIPGEQEGLPRLRSKLKGALRLLKALSPQQRAKPLMYIGAEDLPRLASKAGVSEEEARELLQDFYSLKRLGFNMALQALEEALVSNESASDSE